jgi:glycosyltransferase involved in cell wall biosynthesis
VTRVLIVHQPVDGGVGRHIRDVVTGLSNRGYEMVSCGPALPEGLEGPYVPLDLQRVVAARADSMALLELRRIVRDTRPDIIHAHSSKAGAISRVGRVMSPRIPVIYTPHGYAFAGYFSSELKRRVYRGIERTLAPLANRVICVCEAEGQLARTIGPAKRVRVIHNGIATVGEDELDPVMEELRQRGPVICALTLLRPGKGLETLIDGVPRVLARHPQAQVAIVGEGPDLDALQARASARGVSQAIHFLGQSANALSVLRGADIFVHPSWAESFPYVILEAMSIGVAIVASDVGGIAEAIVDNESGLLVPSGDDHILANALIDLLDNASRRERLGDTAQRRVIERFGQTAMIDRLADVYSELTPPPA